MADSVWAGDVASVPQGVVQNRDSTTHTDGLGMQRQAKVGGKESDHLLGAWKDW